MIVLDSAFLIPYHKQRDALHAAAAPIMDALLDGACGEALLPEYVFLEVVTALAARLGLETAVDVGETLLNAREADFIPCSELFLVAFDVFRRQSPGALSFTDAAIVALARQRQGQHVATFDADFHQVEDIVVVPSDGATY